MKELRYLLILIRRDVPLRAYKKDFANIIYQLGRGIEAHALAFKIFNSNGEIEYNDEECNMIKEYASLCSSQPLLMLSTNYYWNKNNKRKHKRI